MINQYWKIGVFHPANSKLGPLFSADGRYALTDTDAFAIRLWDMESGYEAAAPVGDTGKVLCVAFSPDGRFAASGSSDKTIVVWKLRGRREAGRPVEAGSDDAVVSPVSAEGIGSRSDG